MVSKNIYELSSDTAKLVSAIRREKYMLPSEVVWSDSHRRISTALFDPATDLADAQLLEAELNAQRAVPAGRVLAGAGSGRNVTFLNCFVSPLLQDSMRTDSSQPGKGIMDALADVAFSMQMGGGVGTDFSPLRPSGALVKRIMASASGPLAFMDMWDAMCRTIMSAGYRRGAMMATLRIDHPDILDFITAKRDPGRLRMFNVSVLVLDAFMKAKEEGGLWQLGHWEPPFNQRDIVKVIEKKGRPWYVYREVEARELWNTIMESTYLYAEPGVIFIDRVNQLNNLWYCEDISCTNPCLTGETLIAVAGRGPISIAQLAQEGADIPVFAVDTATGNTVVRWGRSPRLTRRDVPVVRVNLDDGSYVRVTPDHKFPVRAGGEVAAKDLEPGTSLYRFDAESKNRGVFVKLRENKYPVPEYHLIAEAKYDRKFEWGRRRGQYHAHHVDGNHYNNAWDNIEVKFAEDHSSDHMLGDNNPMRFWWQDLSEEEKTAYRDIMRNSTSGERNGMWGRQHSEETKRKIGNKTAERFKTLEQRVDHGEATKRGMTEEVRAKVSASQSSRYMTILKTCKNCDKDFTVRAASLDSIVGRRHYCSRKCALQFRNREIPSTPEQRAARGKKISAALAGRTHSPEHIAKVAAARRSGPHRAGSGSNHKVVSVVPDGYADVYNLTVDEFHNYAVVAFDGTTKKAMNSKVSGIYVSNCGEQPLPQDGNCNLSHVNLSRCILDPFSTVPDIDVDSLLRVTPLLIRMSDNVIDLSPVPTEQQAIEARAKRRIGLGITGLANALMFMKQRYGSPEAIATTEYVMEIIRDASYRASIDLAKEKGPFPAFDREKYLVGEFIQTLPEDIQDGIAEYGIRNSLLNTIAPTGTTSLALADNSSAGLEPVFLPRYTRKVLQPDDSYQEFVAEDFGHRVFANVHFGGDWEAMMKFGLPPYMRTTKDLTPDDHLFTQAAVQKYVDSSVSKTINVPTDTTFATFVDIYDRADSLGCKGCTTYREVPNSGRGAVLTAVKDEPTVVAHDVPEVLTPEVLTPEMRERAEVLEGRTYRLRWEGLPYPLFLTINDEVTAAGRVPFEVFINSKAVDYSHWISALTRMISAVMRKGGDLSFIPDELKAVWSARGGQFVNQKFVPSEVALIGLTLEKHFQEIGYIAVEKNEVVTEKEMQITGPLYAELGIGRECQACGALQVVRAEGCDRCLACGWSNCG